MPQVRADQSRVEIVCFRRSHWSAVSCRLSPGWTGCSGEVVCDIPYSPGPAVSDSRTDPANWRNTSTQTTVFTRRQGIAPDNGQLANPTFPPAHTQGVGRGADWPFARLLFGVGISLKLVTGDGSRDTVEDGGEMPRFSPRDIRYGEPLIKDGMFAAAVIAVAARRQSGGGGFGLGVRQYCSVSTSHPTPDDIGPWQVVWRENGRFVPGWQAHLDMAR
ncbi:hypothetical protein Bbelb_264550 [Branchiostoma belcheri]|nr:hypothetical protein Bbelb_264550 [Branchiostoma belcheri]